ncbi:MAG: hypothetical protein VYE81_00515 [Planctomycetota bacterium]|nr:hypothetical protein [Planctomycetota bacterium]
MTTTMAGEDILQPDVRRPYYIEAEAADPKNAFWPFQKAGTTDGTLRAWSLSKTSLVFDVGQKGWNLRERYVGDYERLMALWWRWPSSLATSKPLPFSSLVAPSLEDEDNYPKTRFELWYNRPPDTNPQALIRTEEGGYTYHRRSVQYSAKGRGRDTSLFSASGCWPTRQASFGPTIRFMTARYMGGRSIQVHTRDTDIVNGILTFSGEGLGGGAKAPPRGSTGCCRPVPSKGDNCPGAPPLVEFARYMNRAATDGEYKAPPMLSAQKEEYLQRLWGMFDQRKKKEKDKADGCHLDPSVKKFKCACLTEGRRSGCVTAKNAFQLFKQYQESVLGDRRLFPDRDPSEVPPVVDMRSMDPEESMRARLRAEAAAEKWAVLGKLRNQFPQGYDTPVSFSHVFLLHEISDARAKKLKETAAAAAVREAKRSRPVPVAQAVVVREASAAAKAAVKTAAKATVKTAVPGGRARNAGKGPLAAAPQRVAPPDASNGRESPPPEWMPDEWLNTERPAAAPPVARKEEREGARGAEVGSAAAAAAARPGAPAARGPWYDADKVLEELDGLLG